MRKPSLHAICSVILGSAVIVATSCVSPPLLPPPPPPPPPPPAACPYDATITAVDPRCAAPTSGAGGGIAAEVPVVADSLVHIRVFYATDRVGSLTPNSETGIDVTYASTQGKTLEYGWVQVSIPPGHKPGNLEKPDWKKFEFKIDPSKHVALESVTPLSEGQMMSALRNAVARTKSQEVFVFIHGFNTTFEAAAQRTAQLAYDLELTAVPVLYSWASQGSPLPSKYRADEKTVAVTAKLLKNFLVELSDRTGATKVHVLAHSMGGRALSLAIAQMPMSQRRPFENVVLAAADISAEVFRNEIVPALAGAAKRVTIYASRNDQALAVSKIANNASRLGQARKKVTVVSGFDTIDASNVSSDWLGHGYIAANAAAINDLFNMIANDLPADRRLLTKVKSAGMEYYKFK